MLKFMEIISLFKKNFYLWVNFLKRNNIIVYLRKFGVDKEYRLGLEVLEF